SLVVNLERASCVSPLSLHAALPISMITSFAERYPEVRVQVDFSTRLVDLQRDGYDVALRASAEIEPGLVARIVGRYPMIAVASPDRKSTRLNSSHVKSSYAVVCLKK